MPAHRGAALLGCLAGALALRLGFYGVGLDRDSAAYATIGSGLRHGLLPYADLFDHKQPLVYAVYAAVDAIAPRSTEAIRLAAAAVSGMSAWLVYLIVAPGSRWAAAVAAAIALVISASDLVEGLDLNTEHLLALTAGLAVLGALRLGNSRRPAVLFAVGAGLGLAILTKAVAVLLVPAVLVAVWTPERFPRRALIAIAGAAAPLAVVGLAYLAAGELDDFVLGNLTYNREYVGRPFGGLGTAVSENLEVVTLCLVAAAAGAARAVRSRSRESAVLSLWTAGALAGALVSSRGYPHYFAAAVPAAAATLGVALRPVAGWSPRATRLAAAVLVAAALPFAASVGLRVGQDPEAVELSVHAGDQVGYDEAAALARVLRSRARAEDRLYAAGATPHFYWLSGVRPAGRYIYDLPSQVVPARWRAFVERDLCEHPPRFVVAVRRPGVEPIPPCLRLREAAPIATSGRASLFDLTA